MTIYTYCENIMARHKEITISLQSLFPDVSDPSENALYTNIPKIIWTVPIATNAA